MVTRKDIARRANVSVSVVSRVLNNSGYVNQEKKKEILQIADEMGYRPNSIAVSLASKRTRQMIFFCRDVENPFNIELYEGMLDVAARNGYMVTLNGKLDYIDVKNMMVDGVILSDDNCAEVYMNVIGKRYYLPVVSASFGNPTYMSRSLPLVECDLWKGSKLILEYLWNKGHRKIALATPFKDGTERQSVRYSAWREFLREELGDKIDNYYLGIPTNDLAEGTRFIEYSEQNEEKQVEVGEDFFYKGETAAKMFYERRLDATAVICFNDELALGFCKKIRVLGYQVPEDVSIVGIDGAFSRKYADVLLTSLALNPRKQGEKCAEVLLDMIHGRKYKHVTQIPMKIVEGESVKTIKLR